MARRVLMALALVALVPTLLVAAPSARQDERVPSARLQAIGDGTITVQGRMVVYGTIVGPGTLVVTDRADDATVHVAGVPQELVDGRVRVKRASGIVIVTGSQVVVRVVGQGLTFSVAGNGRALLAGAGTYRLNNRRERAWLRRWIAVVPTSSPKRRARCAHCSSPPVPLP